MQESVKLLTLGSQSLQQRAGEVMAAERVSEFLIAPLLSNFIYYSTKRQALEGTVADVLSLCLHVLPVPNQKDLKVTKIGKLVNKVAKGEAASERQRQIVRQAEELVKKWKSELNRLKQSEIEAERQKSAAEKRYSEARVKRADKAYSEMRVDNKSDSNNSNSSKRGSRGILIER